LSYLAWKRYFLDGMPSYIDDLIPNQIQQAWIRLAAGVVCSIYILIHAVDLPAHQNLLISIGIGYIALQIHILMHVKERPFSFIHTVTTPIFDIVFLSTALMVDGGQFSPMYLFYFATIMGNGMRFGNRLLFYSQALALIAFPIACFYLNIVHQTPLDMPVFILQLLMLVVLPHYTVESNNHTVNAKKHAESVSFQLLDNSPIAGFTFQYDKDQQMVINYVNQALKNITPLPLEELVGYPIQALFSSDDTNEVFNSCHTVLNQEQEDASFYIRTQGKNGMRQLLGNVRCFQLNHEPVGICFLTDITHQQQRNLEMQETMKEGYMSTLVAGIVHDFRNVLTSIMGTAEMMQFTQKDTQVIADLELIIHASEQGSRMITDLLSLGKASQSEDQISDTEMIHALTSMVNLLRIQLPKTIPLSLKIPDTLPPIGIRLTQLEQILMNLIKNAAEASPQGGAIDVTIVTGMQNRPHEPSQEAMMIQVSDHGIGIAKDNLDKVTKAFWTSRKGQGGTGLGLAMVQRIARQHNGSFHIDSTVGQGTCISLTFPVQSEQANSPAQPDKSILSLLKSKAPTPHQSWRILLVDDNPDVLHVHQIMLGRMNHHVTLAQTGEEGLEKFTKTPDDFDLIITDFIMPGMDGVALCQHIRQQNPAVPLCIFTAFGENEKFQLADDLNIHLISKPISFTGLQEHLNKLQSSAASFAHIAR